MPVVRNTFKRLHYPIDIIAHCVLLHLAYALNLRNIEEMMAERGIVVDHTTLHRWVIRLVPLLENVAPLRGEHGSAAASTVFKIQPHLNARAV